MGKDKVLPWSIVWEGSITGWLPSQNQKNWPLLIVAAWKQICEDGRSGVGVALFDIHASREMSVKRRKLHIEKYFIVKVILCGQMCQEQTERQNTELCVAHLQIPPYWSPCLPDTAEACVKNPGSGQKEFSYSQTCHRNGCSNCIYEFILILRI